MLRYYVRRCEISCHNKSIKPRHTICLAQFKKGVNHSGLVSAGCLRRDAWSGGNESLLWTWPWWEVVLTHIHPVILFVCSPVGNKHTTFVFFLVLLSFTDVSLKKCLEIFFNFFVYHPRPGHNNLQFKFRDVFMGQCEEGRVTDQELKGPSLDWDNYNWQHTWKLLQPSSGEGVWGPCSTYYQNDSLPIPLRSRTPRPELWLGGLFSSKG